MGCIKLNSDVAWLNQFYPAVVVVVARDNASKIVNGIAMRVWYSSAVAGEARAILAAVKMAYVVSFQSIICETTEIAKCWQPFILEICPKPIILTFGQLHSFL